MSRRGMSADALQVEPESTVAGFRVGDKACLTLEHSAARRSWRSLKAMKKRPPKRLSLFNSKAMIQCHNGDETYLISRQEAELTSDLAKPCQDGFEHTQKAESMRPRRSWQLIAPQRQAFGPDGERVPLFGTGLGHQESSCIHRPETKFKLSPKAYGIQFRPQGW